MAALEEGYLPEKLMMLILSKLPVKSLSRFKCVQKSWYSLIESPRFIHLHHRSSSPQFVFNLRVGDKPIEEEEETYDYEKTYELVPEPMVYNLENHRHILSFHSYETLEHLGGDINNDIDIPLSNPRYDGVSLSGSCDGLVCITNHFDTDYCNYGPPYDDTQILICNPATREWRSLFVPPASSGYAIYSVAFGSDPSTPGQYKVVMIGRPRDLCDREALLYDFSTDSWRETGVVYPAPFCYSSRAVSLNGVFHWYGLDIVTFHMNDEVAGSIPMPDFAHELLSPGKELYVSTKSQQLSLVAFDWEGRFEICVMTEYGVKESWTRLFNIIGPLPSKYFREPFAFWDEKQQLLVLSINQLVSCDLQHQNLLRYFPICLVPFDTKPQPHTLVSYSESLVKVNAIGVGE